MSISSLLLRGVKKGRWMWHDPTNELYFESLIKEKKQKKQKETIRFGNAINGLTYAALKVDLKFKSTVNELELMEFRHYLKERNQGRVDSIVTIQDCKIVAIFLCAQQLPNIFHKFYNLFSVNQLLRACILYMQFYLQTCETIVKTQHYLRGNRLTPGRTPTYQALKEDLDDLRVLIGRFYAGIFHGEFRTAEVSRTDEILLSEYFLRVSTVVVWIALERKYLHVIKDELGRIFRTDYFNNVSKIGSEDLASIKKENYVVLKGKIADIDKRKSKIPSRLKSNSPVIHNFLMMDEHKLIMIGRNNVDDLNEERLRFFTKYIFTPETEIQQEGISIGILGLHRRLFDPLLYPCSKRVLKLLVTGSPMDVAEDRKRLRDLAVKKAQRESEPQSPHIFDELPPIPRPGRATQESTKALPEVKSAQMSEAAVDLKLEEEEEEEEEEEDEDEDDDDDDDDDDDMDVFQDETGAGAET